MPLTLTSEAAVTCPLRRDPAEAGRARRHARKAMTRWGLAEHTDLVELIVSELVTNALRHGGEPIDMRLSHSGGQVLAEVHDGGAGRPARGYPDPCAEFGRGLELLDGLIDLHGGGRGVIGDQAGPGKTVYVAVLLPVPATYTARAPATGPGEGWRRGSADAADEGRHRAPGPAH
jgi:anti-sigma regulatory factor (Ser/Thr protein kinase)